ncbi:MAG: hypothetical protein AB7I13_11550 [Vicinamibacterales bacterium]
MTQKRTVTTFLALALAAGATVSCGDVSRQSQSPVYLVLNSLTAKRGGGPNTDEGNTLTSDVITYMRAPAPCSATNPCPTIFNDFGVARFTSALKDITNPTGPTTNNAVTLSRYRVTYRRGDGRNTPGVDVPYPFDGAATVTIPGGGSGTISFEIVRHIAKEESPLVQLASSDKIISTIADITFYGQDQVGNDISVTGSMLIDFGNFGDF